MEICNTLLSRDLKRNLFNLFASWSGQFSKPLGINSHGTANLNNNEEDKLQFSALQVSGIIIIIFFCYSILFNLIYFSSREGHVRVNLLRAMF